MGALLGQRTNNYSEHELGASAGDIAKDIGTFAISPIAFAVRKLGIFGGEKCTDKKLQKRDQIEQAIMELTTLDERRQLVNYANSDISPTPREMANFAIGGVNKWGGDCFHKNVGAGDQRFLDELSNTLESNAQQVQIEQEQSSSSGSSSSGSSGSSSSGSQTDSGSSSNGSSNGSGNNSGLPAQQQSGVMGNNATTYALIGGGTLLAAVAIISLSN